jgi:hypothetical protein
MNVSTEICGRVKPNSTKANMACRKYGFDGSDKASKHLMNRANLQGCWPDSLRLPFKGVYLEVDISVQPPNKHLRVTPPPSSPLCSENVPMVLTVFSQQDPTPTRSPRIWRLHQVCNCNLLLLAAWSAIQALAAPSAAKTAKLEATCKKFWIQAWQSNR